MRLILILLTALSFPAFGQVYKWTDAQGNVHFGTQPPPGQQEEVKIRDSSGVAAESSAESDIIRQARELEERTRREQAEKARDRYQEKVNEIVGTYSASPDYICTGAENRLKSARESWEAQQLQGYTLSEKRRHEQRIRDAERHRDNICR